MKINPYEIKDACKTNLVKYLIRALSMIPHIDHPDILDIGCGTGVPTLALSKYYQGTIYAVDADEKPLSQLKVKIKELNLSDRIIVLHQSVYEIDFPDKKFDIIVAEGLLNVIGFENGLILAHKFIKDQGYFIIHDDYRNHEEKKKTIVQHGYNLVDSFMLDERVWWDEYYQCLERGISFSGKHKTLGLFKNEKKEIRSYKKQPLLFRSMYYIAEKNNN